MNELRQLTPREVLFVGGETSNVYQHTAALVLLDGSGSPDFCFESFRRHMQERVGHIPQFRWKLHEVPLGLDLPYWVEDNNFSLDHHIRRVAVPSPGDHEALGKLVSYLYCRHMDRSRPLWETWFIEGLPGGKYALLQKLHHCVMDGEGAAKLLEILWDLEPDAALRTVDPAIAEARPGEVPERWRMSLNAAMRLSRLPFMASREIFDAVWHRITRSRKPGEKPTAPRTGFNGDISSDRGFVFGSLPLAQIKTVKEHFGVTVNDVVLALVGSSLRDYLLARDALPEKSLRTSIAVSLRTSADDDFSNRVTIAIVTLATDLADPVQRLRAIAEESARAKAEAHAGGSKGVLEIIQMLPPVLVGAMIALTPSDRIPELMGINLIVSNVRGSAKPMYIGRTRIEGVYPMSILSPGGGINVTCVGFADDIHFGVTIEPSMFPEPARLIDGLRAALASYLALAGKGARRSRRTAATPARSGSKRVSARTKTAARRSSRGRKPARQRAS